MIVGLCSTPLTSLCHYNADDCAVLLVVENIVCLLKKSVVVVLLSNYIPTVAACSCNSNCCAIVSS